MRRSKLKKKRSGRKQKSRLSRGSITLIILIGIVIVGAIYLVGGLFPKVPHIDIGESDRRVVIDEEAPEATGAGRTSLRLRTIQFKPCAETAAVDFLLDRSGSMGERTPSGEMKITALQDAVVAFIDGLSETSVIGVQSFSSGNITNDIEIQEKEDFPDYERFIRAMRPSGQTPTHDALAYSYQRLQNGTSKFPDRQFAFVFVSDGQPVPSSQDPRLFNPDPSSQIKDLGVEVFSIGILSPQQIANGNMQQLLTHIASSPDNVYISPQGEDLENIISQIAQDLCE